MQKNCPGFYEAEKVAWHRSGLMMWKVKLGTKNTNN